MDSVWNFQHPGGSFEVEFRADAFNHFVSKVWLGHSASLLLHHTHANTRTNTRGHTHTHTHTHTMRVQDFPAHSHWALTDNTLFINWGVYGEYELELAPSGTVLVCLSVCQSKNSPPPAIPLPPRTTI